MFPLPLDLMNWWHVWHDSFWGLGSACLDRPNERVSCYDLISSTSGIPCCEYLVHMYTPHFPRSQVYLAHRSSGHDSHPCANTASPPFTPQKTTSNRSTQCSHPYASPYIRPFPRSEAAQTPSNEAPIHHLNFSTTLITLILNVASHATRLTTNTPLNALCLLQICGLSGQVAGTPTLPVLPTRSNVSS